MSEEEIIETFKHWIEYEKANKDKIDKADELIEIQQGLLNLYNKEKENNTELRIQISARETVVEELQEKIEEIRDKAEVMDYYTLNDVIEDLTKLLEEK